MAKRTQVTRGQAKRIRELERSLGDRTLRTLLSGGNERLMRPERLANLSAGRGKLQPWERERLEQIQRNSAALKGLKNKREVSEGNQYQVNRALRTWLVRGKERDVPYDTQSRGTKSKQQKAIRALRFLGIDPSEKHYYVRKEAA